MARATRKAEPFSIRLTLDDDRFVENEARRLHRSKGAIVERYAQEGIKARRFPGIAFRGEDYRRRAWVLGTGLDVWEIVVLVRDFGSPEAVAREYGLTEGQVKLALAYAEEFAGEIDELVARGAPSEAEALEGYPFIATVDQAAPAGRR